MKYYLRLCPVSKAPCAALFLAALSLAAVSPSHDAQNIRAFADFIKQTQAGIREGEYERKINDLTKIISQKSLPIQERLAVYRLLISLSLLSNRFDQAHYYDGLAVAEAVSNGQKDDISDFREQQALIAKISQALSHRKSGETPESNTCFADAYRLTERGDKQVYRLKIVAMWSINYANSSGLSKKYLDLNNEALRIAQSLGYKLEACRAASRLGAYYATINKYSFALSYLLGALQYLNERPDSVDKARVLNNIIYVYLSLGDYVKALDYYSIAQESVLNLQLEPLQMLALINLGNLYLSQARRLDTVDYYEAAKKCFLAYLGSYSNTSLDDRAVEARAGLVRILIDQGQITAAEEALAPLLRILSQVDSSPPIKGAILLLKAELALKNSLIQESSEAYQEALKFALRGHIPFLIMSAYCGLGNCAIARHDRPKAIELFNLSIGVLNELYPRIANDSSRASFFNRCLDPFDALISLYAELPIENSTELLRQEAFRLSEFFRARSILEFQRGLCDEGGETEAPAPTNLKILIQRRIDLIKLLAQPALSDINAAAFKKDIIRIDDTLDETLFRSYSKTTTAGFVQPVSVEGLQKTLLSPQIAVIEYYLGAKESVIFFITKDSYQIIRLPSAKSIYDAVEGYLEFLRNPACRLERGFPAATRLYRLLLAPVLETAPPTVEQLIIIPDGILYKLPFESLIIKGSSDSDVTYMNDRYIMSYAPSASSLFWLRNRSISSFKKDLLAIGISEYSNKEPGSYGLQSAGSILSEIYRRNGFNLQPIPYVKDELSELRRKFTPGRVDVLIGTRATETAFKKEALTDYRIIHFACHALSDDTYPLRSALVFMPSPDDADDGFLQLSELYDLRMNAELVVLSACDTSQGKITPNEGLLGMPRIFLYTGAKATISTLWPIEDKSSVKIMSYFYDEYLKGACRARALQVAKQKLYRSSFPHPYYWASYILTGDY